MILPKLSQRDMMAAVTEGVRLAILEVATSGGRFDIPHELLFDAIRQGTRDAVWAVATNATQMPSADFGDSITEGVEKAHTNLGARR